MFGRNDENASQNTNDIPDESVNGLLDSEAGQTIQPTVTPNPTPAATADQPGNSSDWQHPGTPLGTSPGPISDITDPVSSNQMTGVKAAVTKPSAATSTPPDDDSQPAAQTADNGDSTHELIDIKQQALGQLSPLLSHLDQSPEDKFRTLLMMIQASDDQSLVKVAYDAANAIQDEKARAQALLDIVNEINYFTTQHQHPQA